MPNTGLLVNINLQRAREDHILTGVRERRLRHEGKLQEKEEASRLLAEVTKTRVLAEVRERRLIANVRKRRLRTDAGLPTESEEVRRQREDEAIARVRKRRLKAEAKKASKKKVEEEEARLLEEARAVRILAGVRERRLLAEAAEARRQTHVLPCNLEEIETNLSVSDTPETANLCDAHALIGKADTTLSKLEDRYSFELHQAEPTQVLLDVADKLSSLFDELEQLDIPAQDREKVISKLKSLRRFIAEDHPSGIFAQYTARQEALITRLRGKLVKERCSTQLSVERSRSQAA